MNNIAHIIAATELPLVPHLPAVCKAVKTSGTVVIRSDPGSGKSTLVPLALMDYFNTNIIMLEPRRAAVLGIAARLAELLGESTGGRAGYAIRLERKVSLRTKIEVMTEGLLTRRLQENPSLFSQNTVPTILIFDEFHERSIHTDLAFALALDLRRMGAPLYLVIMSATMDAGAAAVRIDSGSDTRTTIIECPGRIFPVTTSYRPLPEKAPLSVEWARTVAAIAAEEQRSGGILVFLPGRREIAACASELKTRGLDLHYEIEVLHGALSPADQCRIVTGGRRHKRRIILATNVAETGLTIPGITLVIDSGYVRLQRFHIPSGMNRLSLEPASAASAEQRAGRAGRLEAGRCIRLWPQGEQRPRETPPEIVRADIAAAVLESLLWGIAAIDGLPWLETPPEAAWNHALELLVELGAIDSGRRPTETGRSIARLGLDIRPGRLCIAGRDARLAPLACAAAAILSERADSGFGDDPDFSRRLSALRGGAQSEWARQIWRGAEDLMRRLGLDSLPQWTVEDEANAGDMMAIAFPDRIALRRDNDAAAHPPRGEGIFRFPSGREARVKMPLASAQWLCALEVDSGERMGFIRLALPVSESAALSVLKNKIFFEKKIHWKKLIPRLIETKKAGRIVLGEKRRPCGRDELLPFLSAMLREQGLAVLPWEDSKGMARTLLERIRFFVDNARKNTNGENTVNNTNNNWNDEALINDAANWLGPYVWDGGAGGEGDIINAGGLCNALINRLGWEQKREMDQLVPAFFTVPSGRNRPIDYGSKEPMVRLRLQDAFGISGRQALMGIPLVFHLLSPADRPIQITRDLDGFWAGSYTEVRKEMRGRYPRHNWPEKPV